MKEFKGKPPKMVMLSQEHELIRTMLEVGYKVELLEHGRVLLTFGGSTPPEGA